MELSDIIQTLQRVKGCTFASLDAQTKPKPGFRKVTSSESVLLFNSETSGYERMVRRRLAKEGRDPDTFTVSDLPWGVRVDGLPSCLLMHHGKYYLQTILLREGKSEYYLRDRVIDPVLFSLVRHHPGGSQGLVPDRAVEVRTYSLESLTRLKLMGKEISS